MNMVITLTAMPPRGGMAIGFMTSMNMTGTIHFRLKPR